MPFLPPWQLPLAFSLLLGTSFSSTSFFILDLFILAREAVQAQVRRLRPCQFHS